MLDFERIEGFEWDAGNARKNERHGVSQAEAEQCFLMPCCLSLPILHIPSPNLAFTDWGQAQMRACCM